MRLSSNKGRLKVETVCQIIGGDPTASHQPCWTFIREGSFIYLLDMTLKVGVIYLLDMTLKVGVIYLLDMTLKAVGPFYLASTSGKVECLFSWYACNLLWTHM